MDLLDKRTQRLALRKALSHTMSLQPELIGRADTDSASRLHKLQPARQDANGSLASSKHALKGLKVRVKSEDKAHQQLHGMESPAATPDDVQHRKGKGMQTPRDHFVFSSEGTPRSRNGQHPRAFDRSHHLLSHPSLPMAQLIESDLFGDFSPRKGSMEPKASAAVSSPRGQHASGSALQRLEAAQATDAATQMQSVQKTGLKVTLKQHRLAMSDAAKAANQEAAVVSTSAEQPATPGAKPSPTSVLGDVDIADVPGNQQDAGFAAPADKVHTMPLSAHLCCLGLLLSWTAVKRSGLTEPSVHICHIGVHIMKRVTGLFSESGVHLCWPSVLHCTGRV